MKQTIVALFAVCLLLACSQQEKQPKIKVKRLKLTEKDLYKDDLVTDVLFEAEGNNIDSLRKLGRKYFLEGIDYYRNKKMPAMAVRQFKKSLLIIPDPKVYYELGNALVANHNLKEAMEAYGMAAVTGFEPRSGAYLKTAAASYMLYKRENIADRYIGATLYNLEKVITYAGRLDTVSLYKDPVWAGIQNEPKFREMLISIEARNLNSLDGSLFGLFKRSFTTDVSNLEIAPEAVDMGAYTQSISYEFEQYVPEMQNATFGREVNNDFFYVGKVKETADYVALMYTSVTFSGEEMQPTYTHLVVYNNLGNIVSSKIVSCQCTPEKIKRCIINGDKITVEDYKRVWEKPFQSEGFENNRIQEHQLQNKAVFRITESGEIVDEDVPANYNDTNIFVKGN